MSRLSSKFLNISILSTLISQNQLCAQADSVLLITNFGFILGEIDIDSDEKTICKIINECRKKIIEESQVENKLFNDGSTICVKNAIVKYSNNMTLNFSELIVHCDDIVGFSPANRQDTLNQLDNQHSLY